MEKIHGDVLRIYVMPPGTAFPWVKLYHHPYGIKHSGQEVDAVDATHDREALVRMIGEMVVSASPILTAWTSCAPPSAIPAGGKEGER